MSAAYDLPEGREIGRVVGDAPGPTLIVVAGIHGNEHAGVGAVRQGKVFDLVLEETDKAAAEANLKAMCEKLLANTVIENYRIEKVA